MRSARVAACVQLLEEEVRNKRGISGVLIRKGYQALCQVSPNAPKKAIEHLFDDFWGAYEQIGSDPQKLADAWLGITDSKATVYGKRPITVAYWALRPAAKAHVVSAIPKLVALFER